MLPHPLGLQKPTILGKIQQQLELHPEWLQSSCLLALFPELFLSQGYQVYHQRVVVPFTSNSLVLGDQTESILIQLQQFLQPGEVLSSRVAPILEDSRKQERTVVFLAGHYYRTSMYHWFWTFFELAKNISVEPYLYATEVAFFDGRSMEEIYSYFEPCLEAASAEQKQRLYNKLAVCYALRGNTTQAQEIIDLSYSMIESINVDVVERECRRADSLNAQALILFKKDKVTEARETLKEAFLTIDPFVQHESKAQRIYQLLIANDKRLVTK